MCYEAQNAPPTKRGIFLFNIRFFYEGFHILHAEHLCVLWGSQRVGSIGCNYIFCIQQENEGLC